MPNAFREDRTTKIINYKNYGQCARFERNGVIAMVTVDLGPRIIYYGTEDHNFLNEDIERNVSKGGEYFDKNFSADEKWYLYGGHRVWKSPEDLESYNPDNKAVYYSLREHGGSFTSKTAENFDYTIDFDMDENGCLYIKNIISNKSEITREIAVWALTVAAKGGVLAVPLNEVQDELNPSQNFVRWPYDELDDERLSVGRDFLILRQTEKENPFKLGLFSKKGRAYYFLKNMALQIDFPQKQGVFGDFWCNFETYTNKHILEIETLSPMFKLKGGESAFSEEKWTLIKNAPAPEFSDEGLTKWKV